VPKSLLVLAFAGATILPVQAARLKRVLILDFKNVEEKANYQYLESSITDAVSASLKEKFAFEESPRQLWETLGKDNLIYQEDFHTQTAAIHLGLLARQDIVIAGRFTIREKASGVEIHTHVRIIDVNSQKLIAKFIEVGPADGRIFDSVGRIATRITIEAAAVLPSKGEWTEHALAETDTTPRDNLIAVSLGVGLISLPKGIDAPLGPESAFVVSDITNAFRLGLRYERARFYKLFPLLISTTLHVGSRTFENSLSASPATGSILGVNISAGSGYIFDLFSRITVMPYLMAGYLAGAITMSAPNDADRRLNVSGTVIVGGGTLAYNFKPRIQFRCNIAYETVWYANGISGAFIAELASSYAF